MATAEKPTIQEIAAMPFPASVEAMRKYYVHDWGRPVPDGVDRKQTFRVEVEYSVSRTEHSVLEIEAFSASEAEELASDKIVIQERFADDCEILNAVAEPKGGNQ